MQTPHDPAEQTEDGEPILSPLELVGATTNPILLDGGVTHTSLDLHPPTGPAALGGSHREGRMSMRIENITSDIEAPRFEVYLNVPEGEQPASHPELLAGRLALFGLMESSRATARHPGNGLTEELDVTELVLRLAVTPGWDPAKLRVTFVGGEWQGPVSVRVGRVSLYLR